MTKKYITSEGKTQLLRKAFIDGSNPFKYMALGNGNSAITEDIEDFNEITGSNYSRVVTNAKEENQQITISGTFAGSNFNPSEGGKITEIALLDSKDSNGTFFATIQVPEITKTNNISLKYSVIVSLL